jgi:hypothetical protein
MATHKQPKEKRIEAVYQTMGADHVEAIENRIRDIACGYDMDLEPALDEAADAVVDQFEKLVAEGFTPDEIEAVLRHHRRQRLTSFPYRETLSIWTHRWLPSHKSERRAS